MQDKRAVGSFAHGSTSRTSASPGVTSASLGVPSASSGEERHDEALTLGGALSLANKHKQTVRRRKVFLLCGFQPLHLRAFLQGHFAQRFPDEAIDIECGLYGDLEQTFIAASESAAVAAAVLIEWSDLDPRLGLRSAGGWALSLQPDILANCRDRLTRLLGKIRLLAAKMPVALMRPTLPLSLLGHTAGWQLSEIEIALEKQIAAFLAEAMSISGVAILNPASLARISPESSRLDATMELNTGFPYTTAHASAIACQVVKLLFPPSPMKGLITDLDETFWSGILGEAGVDGVSWSLAEHTSIHGLYQQMLSHLAEMGVLLAIASKNEQSRVEEALQREDLLVSAESFFPILANWGPKSASVAEILRTWNIAAESVVFVDDSAMEIDEVRTAYPEMKCLQFSKKHPAKMLALCEELRDLFGKSSIHQEDALRQSSIRANVAMQASASNVSNEEFLRSLQGRLTFDHRKDPSNQRLLELINKTNQFNLNGVRISEGEWLRYLEDESAMIVAVSYEDKFGPLGTIGAMLARRLDNELELISCVLSCRAFSRRIEGHMLAHLLEEDGVTALRIGFQSTARNQPLQKYLASFGLNLDAGDAIVLSREDLEKNLQDLPHQARQQNQ